MLKYFFCSSVLNLQKLNLLTQVYENYYAIPGVGFRWTGWMAHHCQLEGPPWISVEGHMGSP